MYSLYSNAEYNLISCLLLVWQFKLFLLPAECHLRKSDDVFESLYFNDVIVAILETKGFAVVVFVVV